MSAKTGIRAGAAFAVAAALIVAGGVLVASAPPASADIISDGGALSLDAAPGVLSDNSMAPGDSVYWPISADLNASTSGKLTLQIESTEALATDSAGLELTLASCSNAWSTPVNPADAPTCNGGPGTTIIPITPFAQISSSKRWQLGTLAAVSQLPMMATLSLPADVPADLQGTSANIRFGFTALGDTENASPNDPPRSELGVTGVDPTGPLMLGVGLLVAGATLGRLRVLAIRRGRGVTA